MIEYDGQGVTTETLSAGASASTSTAAIASDAAATSAFSIPGQSTSAAVPLDLEFQLPGEAAATQPAGGPDPNSLTSQIVVALIISMLVKWFF